jgi:hypothetical protein
MSSFPIGSMSYAAYPVESYILLDKDKNKNVSATKHVDIVTVPDVVVVAAEPPLKKQKCEDVDALKKEHEAKVAGLEKEIVSLKANHMKVIQLLSTSVAQPLLTNNA